MGFVVKILVMGLPGAGKTELSTQLAIVLKAVHFNADAVRANLNKDLGFSIEDRIEQARRMGFLCDTVHAAGYIVIADFVCPTEETRNAFGDAYIIWVNRIDSGRFSDTNLLFQPPTNSNIMIPPGLSIDQEISMIIDDLQLNNWINTHTKEEKTTWIPSK
jgi:adenylylsulfate kinase-like enzyme